MPVSPARSFAYDILIRVERDGSYANELLNAPRMDRLSREDRALCHELVMSTLRWQSELDARIAQYSSQKVARLDGEVRVALRLAVCQLAHLDRIPAHAAVHESVELVKQSGKRSAVPFANAVLRKLAANAKLAVGEADGLRRGRHWRWSLPTRSGWWRDGSTCMDMLPHVGFARLISKRRGLR